MPVDDKLTTRLRLTLKDAGTHESVVAHPRGTGDRLPADRCRSLTRCVVSAVRQAATEHALLGLTPSTTSAN